MRLQEEFQIHDQLNPKLWDDAQQLKPEVKKKIIEIVNYFEEGLQVPLNIVDIQLCGSNASFNYTEKSDLDVHIIANFEVVTEDTEILQTVYDLEKSRFNKDYDITIHGVEIELYVQDIRTGINSNGIYSVLDNAWVKEPKPITHITKHNTDKEVEKWKDHIARVLKAGKYDDIVNCINTLYLIRHNSLNVEGDEFGKGNAIFKDVRNLGLLDKLKIAQKQAKAKELSLESLSSGQLVNRY